LVEILNDVTDEVHYAAIFDDEPIEIYTCSDEAIDVGAPNYPDLITKLKTHIKESRK
jgi:hypothetical protein